MTARTIRITHLLTGAAAVGALLAALFVLRALGGVLASPAIEPDVAARARTAVLLVLGALGAAAVVAAWLIGRLIAGSARHTRAAVLARARGDALVAHGSPLAEFADIHSAVERLAARLHVREAEIQREGHEQAVLLDAITEGILQLDPHGRVVRANPAAAALLGVDATVAGQPVSTRIRHAELRRILDAAARGEAVPAAEVALDDLRLLVSARPLSAPDGTRGGAVVAFVDLTELRRLEGVRRDFVANVSHELKTPLTSIRGYVETLLTDDDLPDDMRRQFLEVVHKNAERLHGIVDDLLDLSRLQSGGWRPELVDVDALDIIEDVWSACSARAERRRIRFVPPRDHLGVRADPAGLRQVLSNLFDNALRYTPDGGRIEVTARTTAGNGPLAGPGAPSNGTGRGHHAAWVTFEVRDTGTGIPGDALPRIFERFYRVDPARSRADGGTGLGLSIVKHLVESMGGEVSADSELGKGTVIRFRLPAAA